VLFFSYLLFKVSLYLKSLTEKESQTMPGRVQPIVTQFTTLSQRRLAWAKMTAWWKVSNPAS